MTKQTLARWGMVVVCAAWIAGCGHEIPTTTVENPLSEIDGGQVRELRFVGTSSPIPGVHFTSTDPQLIRETFARALALRKGGDVPITMPGNITMVQFVGAEEAILAELSIGGDGQCVVLHGPGDARKTVVVASREFCLYSFDLLRAHALHVLQEMLTVDDRGNRELHLKSYPFDRIPPAPTAPAAP